MLFSNLGNENSDAGHIKCTLFIRAAFGPLAAGSPPLL